MDCIVIDYSDRHFKKSLPPRRGGKFIQVINASTEYIIMSPIELSTFHANIAERFFESKGIRGRYNHKRDNFSIPHPEWSILGGGYWEIDDGTRRLELAGTSMAYGRFNGTGLARRMEVAMEDYLISIRS